LCQTLGNNEDKSRTASEMADVLYHSMVLLAQKDVKIEEKPFIPETIGSLNFMSSLYLKQYI